MSGRSSGGSNGVLSPGLCRTVGRVGDFCPVRWLRLTQLCGHDGKMSAKPGRSIRPSQTSASLGASSVAPSRVHSPAEIDHDLEIAVEGEPQPGSLFKFANDHARLFELAPEESLSVVERCAVGKLIINCLLRQWRCNRASVAVPGVAVADQAFCSRQPRRFLRAPTPRLHFAVRLGLGRERQRFVFTSDPSRRQWRNP